MLSAVHPPRVWWCLSVAAAVCLGGAWGPGSAKNMEGGAAMSQPACFTLTSTAFDPGETIPVRHTADGVDVSPAMSWSGAPAGVKEFALICDDPDAPQTDPWVHWVVYALPPDTAGLPEGLPRLVKLASPVGARQGANSWPKDNVGYRGPAPPRGKVHHYHFMRRPHESPGQSRGQDGAAQSDGRPHPGPDATGGDVLTGAVAPVPTAIRG